MDLIQRWQGGDLEAFEMLFIRYKDMVFRTSLLMVGDEHHAEDMLQETFVKVYKSKDKFKGDENGFKQWLYRVTVNICIDHHRGKSSSVSSLEQMSEEGFEPAEADSQASFGLEEKDAIWQAMKFLDDKHRSVVLLKYFHELSYGEIARILDISVGTVKSRLNTAIKTLRKVLVSEEGKEVT